MQLLHDHQAVLTSVRDMRDFGMMSAKVTSSDAIEVKEKRSSDASLLLMNPVASGDNMATGLNSAHKLKEDLPPLIPCCEGRELQGVGSSAPCVLASTCYCAHLDAAKRLINEDLVRTGLSAISVKHDNCVIQCLSMSRACERMQVPPGLVKHRNSFRSLHRPDLKRVPYLRRMSPDELETLFRGYADFPGRPVKCENREDVERVLPPNDSIQTRDLKEKETVEAEEGSAAVFRAIPEPRWGIEEVPTGMRLHVARARLYTSVLAGARAGDQPEGSASTEDLETHVPVEIVPEDEVPLKEELQYIMPPRSDEFATDSTTGSENLSITS